ncbi:hypothetical protein [Parahaliea aestuarii]|uniref:Uncharacterized protein n=1 Tax=Parahaliea aestuarii TaxID=1852021 RepID=A0A5C8ZXL7_9GAMM|nr:hypothetical protein [Parahaliea aestuarii]TXS93216.1 hypothetical protein FVW59_05050 [Parahaliea aestuarii]
MRQALKFIDLLVRILAVLTIILLALPMLAMLSIMSTDSGTTEAYTAGVVMFVLGSAVLVVISYFALKPQSIEKKWPGILLLTRVVVRTPVYLLGTIGFALLLQQRGIFTFFNPDPQELSRESQFEICRQMDIAPDVCPEWKGIFSEELQ